MTPVICMVTGGRGGGDDAFLRRVAAAANAGVDLVQVRERDLDGGPLLRLIERCLEAVGATHTRVLVNDRLDVALAAGAHGVHLRGDSMPASRARDIAPPGFLIGRSVHTLDEALAVTAEGGLDYLVFGPVFATASKPGHAGTGVQALAGVANATPLPVLAIGGVTHETANLVLDAGAAGFAALSLFDTPATVP